MAHNFLTSAAEKNAKVDAAVALANAGYLKIYDGSQPASVATAISGQNLLATLTLPNPAFGAASGGVATANAITGAAISASGTAAWFRVFKSDNATALWDGTCGVGSGFDCNVPTTTFTAAVTLNVTSWTYTQG